MPSSAAVRANRSERTQRTFAIAASTAPTDLLVVAPGQPRSNARYPAKWTSRRMQVRLQESGRSTLASDGRGCFGNIGERRQIRRIFVPCSWATAVPIMRPITLSPAAGLGCHQTPVTRVTPTQYRLDGRWRPSGEPPAPRRHRHLGDTTSVTPARSRTSANRCLSVAVGPRRPVHESHRAVVHVDIHLEAPGGSGLAPAGSRTRSVAAMPAPRWFWRFMYGCESAAWERRRDEPEHRELVERTADELANVVAPPGPVADLGCGPGAHALALARRGYDVVGVDGSPRMVAAARTRAARDKVDATFDVHDVSAPLRFADAPLRFADAPLRFADAPLRFADASLGGVLAILVLQHLPHPAAFIAEIRRCLRPGGHLLITAPARDGTSLTSQNLYWRLRAACYHLVPGVVRFYDTNSLPHLVEDQGLTVVECNGEPGRVSVLARA